MRACILLGAVYAAAAFGVLCFFGDTIQLLFVSSAEVEILANARRFLLVNSAMYFPLALVNIIRFMIQGLGFSKLAIVAGVCEMAARSLVGFCLVPIFGYLGACFANPAAWIAADLFLIPAYFHVMKRLKAVMLGADGQKAGSQDEAQAGHKKRRKPLHALG